MPAAGKPITAALVNDYEIIVQALRRCFHHSRIVLRVVDLMSAPSLTAHADVASSTRLPAAPRHRSSP